MDPTACLRRIHDASRFDSAECRDACSDLQVWLNGGGFAPKWKDYQRGTKRFARWQGILPSSE